MIVTLQTQGLQILAAGTTVDLNAQDGNIQWNPSLIPTYGMPPQTAKNQKSLSAAHQELIKMTAASNVWDGVANPVPRGVRYWVPNLRIISPENLQEELENGLAQYLRLQTNNCLKTNRVKELSDEKDQLHCNDPDVTNYGFVSEICDS